MLGSIVGSGGVGVVYSAEAADGTRVALKLVKPEKAVDETFKRRFQREARIGQTVRHPRVVPVLESGEHNGLPYMAQQFIEGGSLAEKLERDGRLDLETTVAICAQVAEGLEALSAAGMVHRDVKPANILLDREGNAYITDFGFAKDTEGSVLTFPGQALGSMDYMSPEQIRGDDVSAATDVYALGCVTFECLQGRPPFADSKGVQVLFAHMQKEPPELSAYRSRRRRVRAGGAAQGTGRSAAERHRVRRRHVAGGRSAGSPASRMSEDGWKQARSLYDDGAFRRCLELASEQLAATPDDVEWLRLAGRSGVELGSADAVAQLRRVAELRPDADAWRDLGDALATEGEAEAADEAFRKVLELEPDDESALTASGHLAYETGDTEAGVSLLSRAAEQGDRSSSAVISLVEIYRSLDQPEEALAAARRLAGAAPDDVVVALDVAELSLEVGKLDDAAAAFARIREVDERPDHDLYALHGQIEVEIRREAFAAALELAREATALDRARTLGRARGVPGLTRRRAG